MLPDALPSLSASYTPVDSGALLYPEMSFFYPLQDLVERQAVVAAIGLSNESLAWANANK
jgi:hypothetical protein